MKPFENIDNRFLGIVCKGGYYPLGKREIVHTNKTSHLLEGSFVAPDFTQFEMTAKEKEIWFAMSCVDISLVECWRRGA